MNPADLQPIRIQADKNLRNDWTWCMLRPSMTLSLIEDSIRLEEIERRLPELVDRALMAWADHDRERLRGLIVEMGELASHP